MMSTYGERLVEALRIARKERLELAIAINVSVQAVGQVIVGRSKAFTAENSAYAARYLGVDSFWLATGVGAPVVSLSAGHWPFSISLDLFLQLPPEERRRMDEYLEYSVNRWRMSSQVKSKKAS